MEYLQAWGDEVGVAMEVEKNDAFLSGCDFTDYKSRGAVAPFL